MSKPVKLQAVRNIGIAAHVDAGKTTLTERILFYTGASHKIGEVHDGAAHMDFMAEEQEHGITITAAVTRAPWRGHELAIVDTPGHVDFTIEVERSMRVLDGAVLVLDGVRGVEPQSETVWRQRSRFKLPVLFFINKVDRPGADFDHALESVRERLGVEPVAVTVPLAEERAVVDLLHRQLIRFSGERGEQVDAQPCPDDIWQRMAPRREALLLAAAEHDEALADQVLEGVDPAMDDLVAALRKGTLSGELFLTFGGSALHDFGVQPLLDAAVAFLPSPLDRPAAIAHGPDGTTEEVALGSKGSLVALLFKVQLWDGRRHCFARIYRGELKPGEQVEFQSADGRVRKEQVARLFDVDAGRKRKLDRAGPGSIVLMAGLRFAATGDTLCAPGRLLWLERIEARAPVLSLAIEPGAGTDEDKLVEVLHKLEQEDPTLKLSEDEETGQRLLSGMGELHLQVLVERLEREFGLSVRTGRPAVAVRETIRQAGRSDALFAAPPSPDGKRAAASARAVVDVEPLSRGEGLRIQVEPALLPSEANLDDARRAALSAGIDMGLASGPLQGAELVDLELRLVEVELFGAESTLEALTAAAAKAARQAIAAAEPVVLHPMMLAEVVVPDENLGAVLGDLQSRRGLIRDTRSDMGTSVIDCEIALERLLGYTTHLRSLTQGRGQFSMQFERFERI